MNKSLSTKESNDKTLLVMLTKPIFLSCSARFNVLIVCHSFVTTHLLNAGKIFMIYVAQDLNANL